MIVEIVIGAVAAGSFYFLGTTKGKAEITALKAEFANELPKIEASVSSVETKIKTDVLSVVAYLKSKL